ncbi:general substrate transporter [Tuber magnatum]|uniref:General substrate transporter n=1 Tax=Tuber magnatum TaxID=42249 RepID=A0A317SV11_9PEZI|nr:general substrate transporter [Tuber magnatum]
MYTITNIYFITAIAVIGGALFGFDISSMSVIIGTKQYNDYYGPNIDSDVQDGMGRRYSIQIGALTWVLGSVSICIAKNIPLLIMGRFTNGIAVGICSAQVPVYISEISRAEVRGRLVGCQQWAITWGIMIMFYISYGCSHMEGVASFRIPWGVQAVPGAILFTGLFFLPRSPRWLAKKDRWEEAENTLALLHGNGDINDPYVKQEMEDIRTMVELERQNADATFLELFKPSVISRTHIGVFTQIWSQLAGMNVMMYYITYVFAMAGLSGNNLLLSSSLQYVINVVMTVPALIWMDRWGRRKTLLVGSSLMMTSLFSNGIIMASFGHPAPKGGVNGVKAASWEVHGTPSKVIIANSYLFVASFPITWGPASWTYPPELFPLRVRGKAVALCTSANWIFNFALGDFVPSAFENIKWKVYIVFGVFCAVMTVHAFFCFPETAGKSLEEIEAMFQEGLPPWKTRVSKESTPVRIPRVDNPGKADYAHEAV